MKIADEQLGRLTNQSGKPRQCGKTAQMIQELLVLGVPVSKDSWFYDEYMRAKRDLEQLQCGGVEAGCSP